MTEDLKLKRYLVLQSFCPLFVLVFIQHVGNFNYILRFFNELYQGDLLALKKAAISPVLGDVIITIICLLWFLITAIVAVGFKNVQTSNFASHGESIRIKKEKRDSGVTFLVTFILPLLVDDVSTMRGFIFFATLLIMVMFLLIRSDLFYQNPVLVALRYKTYEFEFVAPYKDVEENKTYIGLSKGALPYSGAVIKRRYIADDVFLIYID